MQFGFEQSGEYQDFMGRLDRIKAKLIECKIDFDPAQALGKIQAISNPQIKYAWCIQRILNLLRIILKKPGQDAHWTRLYFPTLTFYYRLNASLPELQYCFRLLKDLNADDVRDENDFLLRILAWDLLQVLNPLSCKAMYGLWNILAYRSKEWANDVMQMPKQLHSKIRCYFHAHADQQVRLLEKIRDFKFHVFLQNVVTPETMQITLDKLQQDVETFGIIQDLNLNFNDLETEHKKRVDTLQFLLSQLNEKNNPPTAQALTQKLKECAVPILTCFNSSLARINAYSYLKPADKCSFIFDAIIFHPKTTMLSGYKAIFVESTKMLAPNWVLKPAELIFSSDSPGKAYVRTQLKQHNFTDHNAYIYDGLTDAVAKKDQYQEDGKQLIDSVLADLEIELTIKQTLRDLSEKIDTYQADRARLTAQILELVVLMRARVNLIAAHDDCSDLAREYTKKYQDYFELESLLDQSSGLKHQIETIAPLSYSDLEPHSSLSQDIKKVHAQLKSLKDNCKIMLIARQFNELSTAVERLEIQYVQDQASFSFPQANPNWRGSFPYLAFLGLLIGAIGLAVSIGLIAGNPYFTYLLLPNLLGMINPICWCAMGLSTGIFFKSVLDLSRYNFFRASGELSNDAAPIFSSRACL